jgi:hypothetical protein
MQILYTSSEGRIYPIVILTLLLMATILSIDQLLFAPFERTVGRVATLVKLVVQTDLARSLCLLSNPPFRRFYSLMQVGMRRWHSIEMSLRKANVLRPTSADERTVYT